MRTIEPTSQFRRDFAREQRGRHRLTLGTDLASILEQLATDIPLEPRHRDHALTGNPKGLRDCHIKPDLVLIDEKPAWDTLRLIRLGSHAELGL